MPIVVIVALIVVFSIIGIAYFLGRPRRWPTSQHIAQATPQTGPLDM